MPLTEMAQEQTRRKRSCGKVLAFLRAHPQQWIPAQDFMALGGAMAWRTRLSDARKVIEAEGGQLQNRQQRLHGAVLSEYRYLPSAPIGRDASVPSVQPELIAVRY